MPLSDYLWPIMSSYKKQPEQQKNHSTSPLNDSLLMKNKKRAKSSLWQQLCHIFSSASSGEKNEISSLTHQEAVPLVQVKHQEEIKPIPAINPLIHRANQFLVSKNYDLFFQMVENGYVPDARQKELFSEYMIRNFRNNLAGWDELEHYLSYGFNLPETFIINFINELFYELPVQKEMAEQVKSNTNLSIEFLIDESQPVKRREPVVYLGDEQEHEFHFYPLMSAQLRQYIQKPDYLKNKFHYLVQQLELIFKDEEYHNHIYYPGKEDTHTDKLKQILERHGNLILRHVDFNEFLAFIEHFSQYPGFEQKFYNQILKNTYQSDIKQVMKHTQNQQGLEYVQQITFQQIQQNQIPNNMVLPDVAKEHIDAISDLYQKIQTTLELNHLKNNLDKQEMIFEVTNLFEKRLPEILKKYLTIDNEYRTSLTNNQGLNAQQLMMKSLENIQSNLMSHWKRLNQDSINDLSASNRYTEHFKRDNQ
jgi:hypothetical protein